MSIKYKNYAENKKYEVNNLILTIQQHFACYYISWGLLKVDCAAETDGSTWCQVIHADIKCSRTRSGNGNTTNCYSEPDTTGDIYHQQNRNLLSTFQYNSRSYTLLKCVYSTMC